MLLGKVLRSPEEEPLRASSLIGGTWQPATSRYIRKAGRPRKEWITTVSQEARRRFGPMHIVATLAEDAKAWKRKVYES